MHTNFFKAVEYKDAKKLYGILPDITLDQLFMKNPRAYENEGLTAPEIAVRIGHQGILCALIEHGIELGVEANFFDKAIIKTLIYNQPDCLLLLIDDSRLQFTSWHLLKKVVRSNCSLDTFCILLAHPVGLNIPPVELGKLVIEAARTGNTKVLEILLAHPVSSQLPPEYLGKAIQEAGTDRLINFRYKTLDLLLQNANKLNIPPQCINKEIIEAVSRDDEYKLLVLLQHTSKLNISTQCIEKAIIEAARCDAIGTLSLLLQDASELNISPECIEKAIIEAAKRNALGTLNLLLPHASELKNLPERIEGTIIEAAGRDAIGTLNLLLQHASELNISPECIEKAIIEAAGRNAVGTLNLLLQHASELKNLPQCIEEAIIEAAKRGAISTLNLLLQHARKFKLNISSQYISKAVSQALFWNAVGTLSLLLEHASKLNISIQNIGNKANDAVRFATEKGRTDYLRVLLDYATELGISPECINDAAWQAVKKKDSICFSLLVGTNEVNLNAQDKTGMTATMFVALHGNFMQLKPLIDKKPDLNITNKKGKSAISLAVKEGNFRCMALLLAENVILSDEDIKCLKAYTTYKDELFGILANEFFHRFGEEKSNKALLTAYFKKDSALHQVFSVKMGATACSLDSGAFKKIRNVLLERKLIRRTATTSTSLSHSIHFKKGGSTKLGTSQEDRGDIELKVIPTDLAATSTSPQLKTVAAETKNPTKSC